MKIAERDHTNKKTKFHLTDLGNAKRLAARHGDVMRYCWSWKKWLCWDGKRWRIDPAAAQQQAKRTVLSIYPEAIEMANDDERREALEHAKASESSARISAMLTLAQSEPGIPVDHDDFDKQSMQLNCLNGMIDLKSGKLVPHDPGAYHTKLVEVDFDPSAKCPTWLVFLNTVFDGNADLIDYVQRLIGYWLTGDVREQVLPIFHGVGANGKSTLINVLADLLGEYAMKAPTDLLMVKSGNAHPTEKADLFSKRLVACVETDDGRRLAESLVKELTGGDRIRARRMKEDFWEFSPTHKLVMATNHRPEIRGTDHAIWRRLALVPFDVVIAEQDQDKELGAKLRSELAGILAWAVRGCLAWQANGLNPPEVVRAATNSYKVDEDALARFIDEHCLVQNNVKVKASDIYAAYRVWCDLTGESCLIQRRFGQQMTERGFERVRNNGIWYRGIGLVDGTNCTIGT